MAVLSGSGGNLKVNVGTFYEPQWAELGEVREWSIQVTREVIDITTQTNDDAKGGWKASIPGWRNWTTSFSFFQDPALPTQTSISDYLLDEDIAKGSGTLQAQFWVNGDADMYVGEIRIKDITTAARTDATVGASVNADGTGYLIRMTNGVTEPPITADFFGDTTFGTAPLTTKFYNRSTGVRLAYQWDVDGDGATDYTTKNPTHVYAEPGVYDVKLTVNNVYGTITKTIPRYIEVLATPTADFTVDTSAGQVPLIVRFTAVASCPGNPTLYYSWDVDGDGKIDYTGQTCEHIYHKPGVYDVKLIVRNRIAATTVSKRGFIVSGSYWTRRTRQLRYVVRQP